MVLCIHLHIYGCAGTPTHCCGCHIAKIVWKLSISICRYFDSESSHLAAFFYIYSRVVKIEFFSMIDYLAVEKSIYLTVTWQLGQS